MMSYLIYFLWFIPAFALAAAVIPNYRSVYKTEDYKKLTEKGKYPFSRLVEELDSEKRHKIDKLIQDAEKAAQKTFK